MPARPPQASSPRVSGRLEAACAAAIALGAVAARIWILRSTGVLTEDFLITLRYAENIAAGRGIVYNPGEWVLGATCPLYMMVLAAAARLGLDAALAGRVLNILADGATCLAVFSLFRMLGRPAAGLVAALLFAATTAPIAASTGGMEAGLVTLAGLGAVHAHARRRPVWMCAFLGLLWLLRADGLLLALFLLGAWLRREHRVPWRALAAGLLVALPWTLFAWAVFGSPLPNSVTAKLAVYGAARGGAPFPNLGEFQAQFAGGFVQKALLAAALYGAAAAWRHAPALRAPLLWMAAYLSAMLLSRVPVFPWYWPPILPFYYGCAGLGLSVLARAILVRVPGLPAAPLKAGALLVLALPLAAHLPAIRRDIANAQALEDTVRRPLGLWLADTRNTRPTDRILTESIGYIGYYSRRPILDAIGLVSPQVIPVYREAANPLGEIVARFRPEVLALRPAERDLVAAHPPARFAERYRLARCFPERSARPAYCVFLLQRGQKDKDVGPRSSAAEGERGGQ